jgi:hypothetical protein
MSDHSEARRGQQAQAVLDNPVYAESYSLIEGELTRKWRESRDPVEREHVHQLLRMLDKARNVLETAMRTGKFAEDKMRQDKSLLERVGLRRVS